MKKKNLFKSLFPLHFFFSIDDHNAILFANTIRQDIFLLTPALSVSSTTRARVFFCVFVSAATAHDVSLCRVRHVGGWSVVVYCRGTVGGASIGG
jgi:hypothetical protein